MYSYINSGYLVPFSADGLNNDVCTLIVLDGIPHASVWLNDTINGHKGTFIPLNNPAINSSSSERLYILTVFRPAKPPQNHSSNHDLNMRLYAIDVTGNMAYRIQTIWHYDFTLPSASIPYSESKKTMCTVSYPPHPTAYDNVNTVSKNKMQNLTNGTMLPADIVVQKDVVFVTVNYNDTVLGQSHCKYLAVTNLGKDYSINFSKDTVMQCNGMAYNSQEATIVQDDETQSKRLMVWLHVYDSSARDSSLLLTDLLTGEVEMNISLSSLLGKSDIKITSRMLIAYLYLTNSTVPHTGDSSKTLTPLIFGITDGSGEASVVAIDLSPQTDIKVIWTVPLGNAGRYVSGQICTVDRLRDSLLVFTDQSGVYFFKIS